MSWLWGNETTAQAQVVVSALQSELDERERKIKALEVALQREQQDMTSLLEDEVKELEQRRQVVEQELQSVNTLIKTKQKILKKGRKKKKQMKSPPSSCENRIVKTSENGTEESNKMIVVSKMMKHEQKNTQVVDKMSDVDTDEEHVSKMLLSDKTLMMVAKEEPNMAFIIQRSNNTNTVVYAGCKLTDSKALDPTNPLKVYWIMYEKDGNPREDLNMIERNTAYGVTSKPSDVPGEYMVAIASLRDRNCILRLDKHGNVMALTTINGKKGMLLRRVFVHLTTSWGILTVDYVDIFGMDPITFEPVYEKKKNK